MRLLSKLKEKAGRWLELFLHGHRDHYTCNLPRKWNSLSSLLLTSLFSHVSINVAQAAKLKMLQDQGIVVFASKHKSNFDYLFYHIRYKAERLPYPEFGFDYSVIIWQKVLDLLRIALSRADDFLRRKGPRDPYLTGYFESSLEAGKAGFLSLVDRGGFHARFVRARHDPLRKLLEFQRNTSRPIFIVPQWLIFSRKPPQNPPRLADILFGTEENPGRFRRWMTILRTPRKTFVEVSDPVNLIDFLDEPKNKERTVEQLSFVLRQRLLDQMNRHRQSITGPVLKTREELKELILRSDRFQRFMREYAGNQNRDSGELHRKADAYLDEIAADYNPRFIHALSMTFGWIWKTMYDGISLDMEGLNRVKSAAAKAPLVFVPCHRSHFDYLILSHLLLANNMPCPHVAAGRNLAFWPAGPLLRKGGAFFIRRSFQGARLYAEVFSEYVRTLVAQGFNTEFFIEGGRSRTGKMILPKTGLLSLLLEAYKDGVCRDLFFVPVYVGYDRLLEENALVEELEGRQKKTESLGQLIGARKLLRKRHGRVYVQFAEPISLAASVASEFDRPIHQLRQRELLPLGRNIAYRIINAINGVSVVTPQALVASAVLNRPKGSFTQEELLRDIEIYLKFLSFQNARLSESLDDPFGAVKNVLAVYNSRRLVERQKDGGVFPHQEQRLVVSEAKRLTLEYYKNNCIHFFVPAAYTALAILSYDAFQFSASALHAEYSFLQNFFKYEFAYDVEKTPEHMVRKTLKAFIDDAILIPHPTLPDTYNITSAGFRRLQLFAGFLKTYFESYWVVLAVLKQHSRTQLVKKEGMKRIRAMGNHLYKRREIERREALSLVNYENGLTFLNFSGIRGNEDLEKIGFYEGVMRKYLNCFMVQTK